MSATLPEHLESATLFIPNLHCPSCIRHIEELLGSIPRISAVSVSLLLRRVTINFSTDTLAGVDSKGASSQSIVNNAARILEESGGFEVVPLSNSSATWDEVEQMKPETSFWTRLVSVGQRERQSQQNNNSESDRLLRHAQHCDLCRDADSIDASGHEHLDLTPIRHGTYSVTSTFTIEGMTCAACSTSITRALEEIEGIEDANISALSHSGIVKHTSDVGTSLLLEVIRDAGYEAEVVSSVAEPAADAPPAAPSPLTRSRDKDVRTIFSIEGMTCSSCAGTITRALNSMPGVRDVAIDVLNHSGTVIHSSATNSDTIRDTIDDAGYPATIFSTAAAQHLDEQTAPKRTLEVRVRGMFCQHCVDKVNTFLSSAGLETFNRLSLSRHTSHVTYIPGRQATIRNLLEGLSALDPAFEAELVKTRSLQARGQEIQRAELKHLSINCIIAIVFAIPAFVIHMVAMTFLPHHDALAMHFMRKVWGAADLGTVILWPLATMVQFGIGRIFYQRAFAPLIPSFKRLITRRKTSAGGSSPQRMWSKMLTFGSMDLLVALSTTTAYFASLAMLIIDVRSTANSESVGSFFSESIYLIMFILLGRVLEAYAKTRTGDAVAQLGALRPSTALLVEDSCDSLGRELRGNGSEFAETFRQDIGGSQHREISADLIEVGDLIRIVPGSLPAADGVIVHGSSTFDESALTGESVPISKNPGAEIYTGTSNLEAAVVIRVTNLGGDTMLEKIMAAVSDATVHKAPIEKLAERMTSVFVPLVVYFSLIVLAIWLGVSLTGTIDSHTQVNNGGVVFWSFEFAIAVLVVACPCGLGLAVPCATAVGNGIAAKLGIIAAGGGEAFVGATQASTVIFDKTGTLTLGRMTVTDVSWSAGLTDEEKRSVELATCRLEEQSSHPLGKGIVDHLVPLIQPDQRINISHTSEVAGRGVKAEICFGYGGALSVLFIGNLLLAEEEGLSISDTDKQLLQKWSSEAKSVVLVGVRFAESTLPRLACMFGIADSPRPTTGTALKALRERGIRTVMLSGDNVNTARAIGRSLGFVDDDVYGEVSPEGKAQVIRQISSMDRAVGKSQFRSRLGIRRGQVSQKEVVMFVGDGLNDAVALAAADVAVGMGHGSQAVLSSADFVLLSSDLSSVPRLIDLSTRVANRQKLNLAWACVFNMVAIPFAAGVFYPAGGIRLNPVWAAIVMACSSLSVVLSSLALRWGL